MSPRRGNDMTSILTNNSAMNALSTLRNINNNLGTTQDRISSGLKVSVGQGQRRLLPDLRDDEGRLVRLFTAINEGLTLTKNSIATARLGAETLPGTRAGSSPSVWPSPRAPRAVSTTSARNLNEIVKQMETTIEQSTFNGDDMVERRCRYCTCDGHRPVDHVHRCADCDQCGSKCCTQCRDRHHPSSGGSP